MRMRLAATMFESDRKLDTAASSPMTLGGSNLRDRRTMIANHKICVVLPAYNAARTLETTVREIATDVIDDVILVDDASTDDTLAVAKKLGIFAVAHDRNKG